MADVNCITVSGHLTKAPELKELATGNSVLNLSLANNTGFGQYAHTTFFDVCVWSKSIKNLVPYLQKGTNIACSGTLHKNEYTTKDGRAGSSLIIETNSIVLLSNGKSVEATVDNKAEATADNKAEDTVF